MNTKLVSPNNLGVRRLEAIEAEDAAGLAVTTDEGKLPRDSAASPAWCVQAISKGNFLGCVLGHGLHVGWFHLVVYAGVA